MKKKHLIGWLLVLVMLVGLMPTGFAGAEEALEPLATEAPAASDEDTVEEASAGPLLEEEETGITDLIGIQEGTNVVVGAATTMTGYFGLGLWGDNASDSDVRELLHGYETVAWTRALGMRLNETAVLAIDEMEEADGSWTFTLHLTDDLTYNDGSPITARDFVFSLLLLTSPQIRELDGMYSGMEHLVGYEEYTTGQTTVLHGVKLLSDSSFSMQVQKEYLPYYYGINLLNVQPYPISVIAPGCEVRDDGEGAYLATAGGVQNQENEQGYVVGEFSTQMLRHTLLDPQTGYEFYPYVTCGPYSLESYDPASQVATFWVNPQYAGNYQGQKPHIEHLVFKKVSQDTMLDEMERGEVDVLVRLSESETITRAREMQESGMDLETASYPRSGLAFLAFACEDGPTASASVRQAISLSFDKPSLVRNAVGNHAQAAYGYYGVGQWMTEYSHDGDEVIEPIYMAEELEVLKTSRNVPRAKALLEEEGWNLNENGDRYEDGVDGVRYRREDGELVPLTIKWAISEESVVAGALQEPLGKALEAIGIDLQTTKLPFEEVLAQYYRTEERVYNMFFMASNFAFLFDPYYDFSTNEEYQGVINKTGLQDASLQRISVSLRQTDIGDNDAYARKWLEFQKRFAELLPVIPLYSNNYYDFYDGRLQDYQIDQRSGWSLGIVYVWIDEDRPTVG